MAHKLSRKKEVRLPNAGRPQNDEQYLQNKRLKALYDAIDAGRNKDSIDIADKIIRKFGSKDRSALSDKITVNTAQALKALALIRSESTGEAAVLVEGVEQALIGGEFNEGTLQVLFHCFKESYIPNRIPQLIEKVLRVQPATEGLLLDLYFGYARIMDFKNQQRVANLLYKDYENWKYFFWAVNSVVLQAMTSPSMADKIYYPLAQKMLEKFASKEHRPSRMEVLLNCHVLSHRGLYDEALDYLGKRMPDNCVNKEDAKRLVLELLRTAKKFEKLEEYVEDMIKTDRMDYNAWETLFWIYEQAAEQNERQLQERVARKLDELLREHLSDPDDPCKYSNLLLKCTFIKLVLRLGTESAADLKDRFGTLLDNLKQLIRITYKRSNAYSEISQFFHLFSDEERFDFLRFFEAEFESEIKQFGHAHLIHEQLRTGFGHYRQLDISQRHEFIVSLVNSLRDNAKHNPDLDTHASAVAVIVANILWSTYSETGSTLYLLELAAALEFIFDRCSNVYLAAILLMRVYTVLGNMNRIVALFNQLDIKYFQRDSLGYLTFTSAMQYGRFREAIYYYSSITAQFDHNERETIESIVMANKVGSLDQIPQLVDFNERCRLSMYAHGADVLNQLLSACFAVDNLHFAVITLRGDEDRIEWNKITDSRDFGILQPISLTDETLISDLKATSFRETLDYIILLHDLARVVSDVGVANLPELAFDADYAALRAHLAYCKSMYAESEISRHLQGFGAPQMVSFLARDFLAPIMSLFGLVEKVFALERDPASEGALGALVGVVEALVKTIRFEDLVDLCDLDASTCAQFLEHSTHCILVMTLCELVVKFMEARVAVLLPRIKENRRPNEGAGDKPTANATQLTEKLADTLTITKAKEEATSEDGATKSTATADQDNASTQQQQSGRKPKKSKKRPFDELTDEQKLETGFKIAQQQLLDTCQAYERRVLDYAEKMKAQKTFFDADLQMNFEAASLDRYASYVDRSLGDSHSRSLEELRVYTGRIRFFASLPRFNLLNVHFAGNDGASTTTK